MKNSFFLFLIFFSSIFYGYSIQEVPQKIIIDGFTQNTYYRVTYYAKDSLATKQEIESFLGNFLKTASLWEKESIIAKINRNEITELNEDFMVIFHTAEKVSQLTNGAFDITVGKLVNAWGFGIKTGKSPTPEQVDSMIRFVGYQKIKIIDRRIVKEYPEIEIDFNAIAKGYSVDLMANFLISKGINNFLVDIGGEIRASGAAPNGDIWLLGIENPSENSASERQVQEIIQLTGKSVATSGSYRKYIEKDGVRFSHTIDPKTGYPVSHHLLSATVIADDCITADALATAFMVMGEKKAMQFLNNHPEYDAYFIVADEIENLKICYSKGFQKYFYSID